MRLVILTSAIIIADSVSGYLSALGTGSFFALVAFGCIMGLIDVAESAARKSG